MREILFRGKKINSEDFVYGCLFQTWDKSYILWGTINGAPNQIEVDPKTVGQYTGLNDKNGVEIYESDIVIWKQAAGGLLSPTENEYTCQIIWDRTRWACQEIKAMKDDYHSQFTLAPEHISIIGNVHSNPELLK